MTTQQQKPILAGPAKDAADRAALLERYSQRQIDRAIQKERWLKAWWAACKSRTGCRSNEKQEAQKIVVQARKKEGPRFKISVRSLQGWSAAYRGNIPGVKTRGLEALIDRFAGGLLGEARSQAAIDFFLQLYQSTPKPTIKVCHVLTGRKADKQNWSWPMSYSATKVWLRKIKKEEDGLLD